MYFEMVSNIVYFIFVLGVTHVPNLSFAWIWKKSKLSLDKLDTNLDAISKYIDFT